MSWPEVSREVRVSTQEELVRAIRDQLPGDTIVTADSAWDGPVLIGGMSSRSLITHEHDSMMDWSDGFVGEYRLTPEMVAGKLCFDVGAYIGTVARWMARNGARVVAVEPVPENAAILRCCCADLDVSVVEATLGGLTDITYGRVIEGGEHRGTYAANTALIREGYHLAKTAVAETTTLEAIVAEHGVPDVMKIDCEGAEWSVFEEPSCHRIGYITGEWHEGVASDVTAALPHHDVWFEESLVGFGIFHAALR